jgi:CheY-like chemotaxis protein
MGLAIAKTLVELHAGTIAARSAGPGRGSEFTLSLPHVAGPPHHRSGSQEMAEAEAPEVRLKVVVVDDNVDIAAAVGEAVRLMGHEVAVVHRAPAALDALSQGPVDIALIDIGLPGMDGYELARLVRARAPGPRVCLVALTGYGDESFRARSRDSGFDAYLVKPIEVHSLRAILGSLQRASRRTRNDAVRSRSELPS